MKNKAAVELGKSGGLKKSEKKTAACRKNARKPRARWATAIYYKVATNHGAPEADRILLMPGKKGYDLVDDYENVLCMIESHEGVGNVKEILEYMTMGRKI